MDISVIIVSYNTADLIAACLKSVFASRGVSCEAFVVDNASADHSVDVVRKQFPGVKVIANETNRGFGAANNQALAQCTGRYVVFLNPDTTVEPEALQTMVAFMDAHPEVGIAGPRVLNPDGTRQDSVSYRYPAHRYGTADLGSLPGDVACVIGACQIATATLLHEVHGFDEDFFLYGEDQDLCLRIRKRGFSVGFIEDAIIMHHGGHSERKTIPADLVRKKLHGEFIFYRKHYRPKTAQRICRKQRLRALWRIFFLKLRLPFLRNRQQAQDKLSKYRVILEECRTISPESWRNE